MDHVNGAAWRHRGCLDYRRGTSLSRGRLHMIDWGWTQAGASAAAAFLASMVEFIEALTVVLAVGAVRGWPGALVGAGIGLAALVALTAALAGTGQGSGKTAQEQDRGGGG